MDATYQCCQSDCPCPPGWQRRKASQSKQQETCPRDLQQDTEKPPKCPRALRYQKNTLWAETLEPRENTQGYFFWCLQGPDFRPGGYFSVFVVKIPGRAISGLCSTSGRSQQQTTEVESFSVALFTAREAAELLLTYKLTSGGMLFVT